MDGIVKGDHVEINWENIVCLRGTVRYVPCEADDFFIIDGDDGELHYVQHFCVMTKRAERGRG